MWFCGSRWSGCPCCSGCSVDAPNAASPRGVAEDAPPGAMGGCSTDGGTDGGIDGGTDGGAEDT